MKKNLIESILMLRDEIETGMNFIGKDKEIFISYQTLYYEALELLYVMKKAGVEERDEIIIQCKDNYEFIKVLWASILGKMVVLPLPANDTAENNMLIRNVFMKTRHPRVVTTRERLNQLSNILEGILGNTEDYFYLLDVAEDISDKDRLILEAVIEENSRSCKDNDIAIIQFSSGSTGFPKGVEVSHGNIIACIEAMIIAGSLADTDKFLSWLPLYHNFGLIVMHITPLFLKANSVFLQTEMFLMNPKLWMENISRLRATLTASPNFGFKMYLDYIRNSPLQDIDISCIRLIFNGAEPISGELCMAFLKYMSVYNLSPHSLLAGYGLSEATVAVSSVIFEDKLETVLIDADCQEIGAEIKYLNSKESDHNYIELVSVGKPFYNTDIQIADDSDRFLGENQIGNIQIYGNIVSRGYYRDKEATTDLFTENGWLRTGDIGFLKNGHLYICGRKKDIIFVNGKNYYPHDIERHIRQCHNNVACAVVGIYDNVLSRDLIIVFLEVAGISQENLEEISTKIKKYVMQCSSVIIDDIITVDKIPKTASGKIKRYLLAEEYKGNNGIQNKRSRTKDAEQNRTYPLNKQKRDQVINTLKLIVKEISGIEIDDLDESFMNYGINSIRIIPFNARLKEVFNIDIPVSAALDFPSFNRLADYIISKKKDSVLVGVEEFNHSSTYEIDSQVAIVGMGCRFPGGADNIELFWDKLISGFDAITELPPDRKELHVLNKIDKFYGCFLQQIGMFDPAFFNITPIEAKYLDPQQRILLETTQMAMENAGIDPQKTKDTNTGVFIGISTNDYIDIMSGEIDETQIDTYMITGNMSSMAAGRVGYVYDWHGPMISVDTACSSSMTAIHLAVQSLIRNECCMALAGGVNVILSPKGFVGLKHLNALSKDGKCKTFDESADGYVRSEGCGVIVLKRLQDAIDNNDRIVAIIKGTAINHDGRSSGLTAPNGLAQTKVILNALKNSGVAKDKIGYIETHGTGTKLGDPQELNALADVFTGINHKIVVGSVKTNIGHTESSAGVAGLIKTALMLNHRIIPGNDHLKTPSLLINWDKIPLIANGKNLQWNSDGFPSAAGISSFGFSGTNVHVIMEEAPQCGDNDIITADLNLFTVSARNKKSLLDDLLKLKDYLTHTSDSISDICYTTNRGRSSYSHRVGIVTPSKELLIKSIDNYLSGINLIALPVNRPPQIVFMFSDKDIISAGTAKYLYRQEECFRSAISECEKICSSKLTFELESIILGKAEYEDIPVIDRVLSTLAVEFALIKLLDSYDIIPDCVIGYGVGELMSAYMAGFITHEMIFELAYAQHIANFDIEVDINKVDGLPQMINMRESDLKAGKYQYWKTLDEVDENEFCQSLIRISDTYDVFIEIGSEAHISNMLAKFFSEKDNLITPVLRKNRNDYVQLGQMLMSLYERGINLSFRNHKGRKVVSLPSMSMNRKYYWFD